MLPQLTPILVSQVWQQECKHLFPVEWMKAKHMYGPCSIFVTQYCVLCAQLWFPALSPGECHNTILQKHLTRGVTIFWQNMYSWWCIILCLEISHKQSCMCLTDPSKLLFSLCVWLCAQVHYHHDFAALGAKVHGLKVAPEVELSANIGSQKLYVGGSVLYNTQLRTIGMTKAGKTVKPYPGTYSF